MNRQLDTQIMAAYDEIVRRSPDLGDTPTVQVVYLSAHDHHGGSRLWVGAAAASVVAIGVGGLLAAALNSSDSTVGTAAQSPGAPAANSTVNTSTYDSRISTTVISQTTPLIPVGSVVCVVAGASLRAATLCNDELGGPIVESTASTEISFVMPVDPTNPDHVAATANVGEALNLLVRELDTNFLPSHWTTNPIATTYLVLGTTNSPYAPSPNPPAPGAGPLGAMVLPEATGMTVEFVEEGSFAGDSLTRSYTTSRALPETEPYLRIFSYQNDVPADQSFGCVLAADETRDVVLGDGTSACLEVRGGSDPFGRIALDRSPYSVVIEGNVSDDELLNAAEHLVASEDGTSFEISAAGLPSGVTLTGISRGVSDFATTGVHTSNDSMVQVNWINAAGHSIFYVATTDDAAFTPSLRLGFESVTDTTVRGVPAFIRTLEAQPRYLGVVWRENDVTYQVGSQQLTESQLLDLVEQMRPATNSEWATIIAAAQQPSETTDTGPATATTTVER